MKRNHSHFQRIVFLSLAICLFLSACTVNQPPKTAPMFISSPEPEEDKLYDPGVGNAVEIFLPYRVREKVGKGTPVNTRWYKLDLDQSAILKIDMRTNDLYRNLELRLLDRYESFLDSGLSIGKTETISKKLEKGVYYIKVFVTDDDMGSSYFLDVKAIPLHGSSMEYAHYIGPGINMDGLVSIGQGIPAQWYKFENGHPKAMLELWVKPENRSHLFDVKLYDNSGRRIAGARGSGATRWIVKKVRHGNYFVQIKPPLHGVDCRYKTGFRLYPLDDQILKGPGSDIDKAVQIPFILNIAMMAGQQGKKYGLKERWYQFETDTRRYIDIRWTVKGRTPLMIELQTEDGQTLDRLKMQNNQFIGRIVNRGRYFLKVFPEKRNRGQTHYTIKIEIRKDPGAAFIKTEK